MRLAVASAALFLFAAGGAAAQVTALQHVTLIDGSGGPLQRDRTILIENGHIRAIEPTASARLPGGASAIDLAGKYVVPGIINAHGHVGPAPRDPQLRQYALYGVTTTTSMSFDNDDIADFKAAQRRGDLRGARILTVKYRFMSGNFHPGTEYKTPEAARAKVDEIVRQGADFIKVWVDNQFGKIPKLDADYTAAVMDQARRHDMITMAHIVEYEDAKRMLAQGVNILAHDIRDRDVEDSFIAEMKRRNVTLVSTLAREEGMFVYGEAPGFLDDPFFQKGLSPERLQILKTTKRAEQAKDPERALLKRMFETDKRNLKRMADAGVRIALGTDSGGEANRFFVQGWFEHRQMQLMAEAGLTPMQIIQSFSKGGSEALGIDKEFGTLAAGKAADLLVLTRNPLEDITNMRAIETVYLGGRRFN